MGRHSRIGMLAGIVGCGKSHHTAWTSTNDLMARWNAQVGSAVAMKVYPGSTRNPLATAVSGYKLDTTSWMALTAGAGTDMACTNLLLSDTDMRYSYANELIKDGGHAADGDVRFSYDRSAGEKCSVEPAPKAG